MNEQKRIEFISRWSGLYNPTMRQDLDALIAREVREETKELVDALGGAEAYMVRQRAKSKAPFDPEVLKQVRAVLAKYRGSK